MLKEFESKWDGHLERINVAKHRIDLLIEDVRPAHSAPYRAGPAARKFAREEIGRMITKKVIEQATTEHVATIVVLTEKNGSSRFCGD